MSPSDKASLTGYLDLRRCRHIAMQNRLRIHITTGTDRRIFEEFGNDIATGLQDAFCHTIHTAGNDNVSSGLDAGTLYHTAYDHIATGPDLKIRRNIATHLHASFKFNISGG